MQTKVDVFFNSPKFCTKFSNCVQKLGGGSEKFKDCLSTRLVRETCFFSRLALTLTCCASRN